MGSSNPLQPLAYKSSLISNAAASPPLIQTLSKVKKSIEQAQGTPVMLDFYADWCASCKEMEATTFQNPEIKQALSHFKVIKIDVSANNADSKELMNYFNVIAPPTFIFFNAAGKQLNPLKSVGERSAAEFLPLLNSAATL